MPSVSCLPIHAARVNVGHGPTWEMPTLLGHLQKRVGNVTERHHHPQAPERWLGIAQQGRKNIHSDLTCLAMSGSATTSQGYLLHSTVQRAAENMTKCPLQRSTAR